MMDEVETQRTRDLCKETKEFDVAIVTVYHLGTHHSIMWMTN